MCVLKKLSVGLLTDSITFGCQCVTDGNHGGSVFGERESRDTTILHPTLSVCVCVCVCLEFHFAHKRG